MAATLALAGDTMLGRGVARRLLENPAAGLVGPCLGELLREADAVVLNLECCISARGRRWPDPAKPFFFRAPPRAAELLAQLGVRAVTLANNHALDFGVEALLDTLDHLTGAGIAVTGAGAEVDEARRAATITVEGEPLSVIGLTDHPEEYAATPRRPGVAYADLRTGVPGWVLDAIEAAPGRVLVTPHWGPNMVTEPLPYVRRAAAKLAGTRAMLVAGHSAHVFQGVAGRVLFDLGDFVHDYATDPQLRNDLGILWLVTIDGDHATQVETVPLQIGFAHTEVAAGDEAAWVRRRLRRACAALGTPVEDGEHPVIRIG